jgi:hypothetical protein|tara:strand:- start:1159 stop:3681 length:2523 start_codon:yes stop_codon:yes gene_type:complete
MKNIAVTIPNLIQGVSLQPDAQKDPSQGEIQINGVSSIAEGLRKRDSSRTLARVSETPFGDAFFHTILRDQEEEYIAVITNDRVRVFELDGTERTVTEDTDAYDYLDSITDATQQVRAVTIADYTWITNTLTNTAMDTALAPETARPREHECLVWVKQAVYGNEYVLNLNGTEVTVETPVAAVVVNGSTVTENRISSEEIAQELMDGITDADIDSSRSGSVIWFRSDNPITVEATDAKANATITAILNTVQVFTELPTIAPEGYQINVTGDPGTAFDDFHLEFNPRSGDFGEGEWEETVAPGTEYMLDPTTMPHVLIRQNDGDFWFGPVNGQTVAEIPGGVPTWGRRIAGDIDTSPDPSFIGFPINDIFIYKNRLGFLADENVVLSRVREFFEFFPETVTTVLDTDPIDVVASNNKVSVLRYAVPYQDELILFSAQIQFRFNAAETVLTPATAQITALTQFDVDTSVRPQQAGGGIFFLQSNGQWSQMREFAVRGAGTALTADAADLTGYISSYIPDECFKMTVNDTGNAAFLLSGKNDTGMLGADYRKRIYVYKWFLRNRGEGAERAQNSWSYWEFGADEVLQIVCIREILYCLMRYGDEIYLEQISVLDRAEESVDAPYPLLLDRLVSTTTATPEDMRMNNGVYNEQTNQTTFTLPYTATNEVQVWSAYNMTQTNKAGPVLLGSTDDSNTVTARGNWSAEDVWAGEKYEFRYRFSRFKLMDDIGGGKAVRNVVRTQVRQAKLAYQETSYFQVKVIPEGRKEGLYTFDGTVLAVRNSTIGTPTTSLGTDTQLKYQGVFNVPIMGRGDRILVELLNDTPHPSKFSTLEWIGMITSRSGAS